MSVPSQQMPRQSRVVLKFGGTSVADLDRIANAAEFIKLEADAGHGVVVVVSAMAGETNRLVDLVQRVESIGNAADYDRREYDAVVSSGEQVTSGLLALTLQRQGYKARSWQGWQIPLRTNEAHGRARIVDIPETVIGPAIDAGEIAIIAGFQGITDQSRISTLGRGGSDTTAVALAAALGAERCDIYTDIDGVYTTDPRITSEARRLDRISYEEMLEMASLGAKVLQTRSVELAMAYNVQLRVLSSFANPEEARAGKLQPCTVICNEDEIVEKHIVSGITHSHAEAKISLMTVPDEPGRAARIFEELAAADINVDMIVQSPAKTGKAANISFSLDEGDVARAQELLATLKDTIGYTDVVADRSVSKVSVIGVGMKSHAGVAATMFKTLADRSINILNISTSEIKISVLIHSEYTELAVRALHQAYGLEKIAEAS
ncbi:MAG: aspartate kinase [Aquisalinus sp.]|nr:aspartate kinase [Aquisalinus sp.]